MKKLNFLAINPQYYDEYFLSFPLGLATIVAIVKKEGHNVQVIDFDAERRDDSEKLSFFERVSPEPDVIMITGMITNYIRVRKLSEMARGIWPNGIIVVGGSIATTAPESILKQINADIFVIGEGDEKIKWIIEAISSNTPLEKVPGIKLKLKNNIYVTRDYDGLLDITRTPRPDYEAFPVNSYINFLEKSGRSFEIYTSKGCPFSCIYCYRISGRKPRFRLVNEVIKEIQFVKNNYSIDRFSFEDDCFGINRKWLDEFCKKVKDLDIKFRFQTSVSMIKEEVLDQLQSSGLFGVSIGIESASPSILKAMGKNISLLKAERVIESLRSRNIKYNATFIIGMPGETGESIKMLRDFLIRNSFKTNFQIFFLTPYPETEIYKRAVKEGIIKDEEKYIENLKFQNELTINLTAYPSEKLLAWKEYILSEVLKSSGGQSEIYSGVTWQKYAI